MALYDEILKNYLNDAGDKISDAKKSEIFNDLKSILINGPTALSGIPIPQNFSFEPVPLYADPSLNFPFGNENISFKSLEDNIIDGFLKNFVKIINVKGQTPFPFIFDITGLLPSFPTVPNNLSLPPTPLQIASLIGIPDIKIIEVLKLNELGISIESIKIFSLDELKNVLPEKNIENLSKIIKTTIEQLPISISPEELANLFNPFKIPVLPVISLPPIPPQDAIEKINTLVKPINDILDSGQNLSSQIRDELSQNISQISLNVLSQYTAILNLPFDIINNLIQKLISNIGLIANPLALIGGFFESILQTISDSLFPFPGTPQNNQEIVMKLALTIVITKFVLKAVLKVIIGLFLGNGLISEIATQII